MLLEAKRWWGAGWRQRQTGRAFRNLQNYGNPTRQCLKSFSPAPSLCVLPALPLANPCKPQETSQFWATMCETWGLWGAASAFRQLAYALDVSCSDVTSELNTDSFLLSVPGKHQTLETVIHFPYLGKMLHSLHAGVSLCRQ